MRDLRSRRNRACFSGCVGGWEDPLEHKSVMKENGVDSDRESKEFSLQM